MLWLNINQITILEIYESRFAKLDSKLIYAHSVYIMLMLVKVIQNFTQQLQRHIVKMYRF